MEWCPLEQIHIYRDMDLSLIYSWCWVGPVQMGCPRTRISMLTMASQIWLNNQYELAVAEFMRRPRGSPIEIQKKSLNLEN